MGLMDGPHEPRDRAGGLAVGGATAAPQRGFMDGSHGPRDWAAAGGGAAEEACKLFAAWEIQLGASREPLTGAKMQV